MLGSNFRPRRNNSSGKEVSMSENMVRLVSEEWGEVTGMLMVWCIGESTLEYAKYSGMVNF